MTSDAELPAPPPGGPAAPSPAGPAAGPVPDKEPRPEKKKETWWSFLRFLLILFVASVFVRSCIAAPFMIPSGSMLPTLMIGDYLFVSKWNYGYSQYSYPFGIIRYDGRVMGSLPERGDVIVFRTTGSSEADFVKRVIGVPGDRIEVRESLLYVNGQAVQRQRIADFVQPVTENMIRADTGGGPCHIVGRDAREEVAPDGTRSCHYARYVETLPSGRSYEILDQEIATRAECSAPAYRGPCAADNFGPIIVPDDHVFVMGDNRDDSLDSRFPITSDPRTSGVSMLPVDNIQGRALVSFFSTDGSAEWLLPWTWFTAARGSRIGMTYP
jgi:signal peptidase I